VVPDSIAYQSISASTGLWGQEDLRKQSGQVQ